MPFKRTRKSYKKKYPRKPRVPRNLASVDLSLGFPKTLKMTHKYCELVTLSSVGGSQTDYVFKCNGMNDPNVTGVGHQPMFYDQMSALYNHFTVIGSRIKYTISSDSVGQGGAIVSCYVNDDTSVVPTLASFGTLEQSSSRYRVIPAGCNDNYNMRLNWSGKKTFGKRFGAGGEKAYQGTGGSSDPTETSTFTISASGVNLNTVYVTVLATIEYIAVWSELKDLGGS